MTAVPAQLATKGERRVEVMALYGKSFTVSTQGGQIRLT